MRRALVPSAAFIVVFVMTTVVVVVFERDQSGPSVGSRTAKPTQEAQPVSDTQASISIGRVESPIDPLQQAYAHAFANQYTVHDPAALYDEHIGRAEAGEASSMVFVAEAIRNCVSVPYSSRDEFMQSDLYHSGSLPPDLEAAINAMIDAVGPECARVNSKIPEDQRDHFTWSNHWYDRAAEAGHPIAALELSLQLPLGREDVPVVARLLNAAYASGDDRVFYYASRMYANAMPNPDPTHRTVALWSYLGCMNHDACSTAGMRRYLEEQFLPVDVELIVSTAVKLDALHPTLDFTSAPTIYELAEASATE